MSEISSPLHVVAAPALDNLDFQLPSAPAESWHLPSQSLGFRCSQDLFAGRYTDRTFNCNAVPGAATQGQYLWKQLQPASAFSDSPQHALIEESLMLETSELCEHQSALDMHPAFERQPQVELQRVSDQQSVFKQRPVVHRDSDNGVQQPIFKLGTAFDQQSMFDGNQENDEWMTRLTVSGSNTLNDVLQSHPPSTACYSLNNHQISSTQSISRSLEHIRRPLYGNGHEQGVTAFSSGNTGECTDREPVLHASVCAAVPQPIQPQQHQQVLHDRHQHQQQQQLNLGACKCDYSSSPAPIDSGGGTSKRRGALRSVKELPEKYRPLFSQFPYFNLVQSTVFEAVYNSERSLVVSAPTGSGKTAIMELAVVREVIRSGLDNLKIVYMAPLKALVAERFQDWQARLVPTLGLQCAEMTGDTEHDDSSIVVSAQVILTTPEKLDSVSRRWRDRHAPLLRSVSLLLIDEVHVLGDAVRGPTVEAVVSRLKTIRATSKGGSVPSRSDGGTVDAVVTAPLRLVAVSATIPNVGDVAAWLGEPDCPAQQFKLGEELRPVPLRRVVLGYPCPEAWSQFRFDISLTYKLAGVIATYSEGKPALVFVSTRKGGQQSALTLVKQTRLVRGEEHQLLLTQAAATFKDNKLRECVSRGVGFHHAGLDAGDRRQLEALFVAGHLPVILATSTLAMGVNLPAHLVVIKSTSQYGTSGYAEYPATSIMQMIGRAGRPQYDTSATAVIMTTNANKVGGKEGSIINT